MENPVVLGCDSWLPYNFRVYRTVLTPHKSGYILGEVTLRLDDLTGTQALVISTTEETNKFHLVYSGTDLASLSDDHWK